MPEYVCEHWANHRKKEIDGCRLMLQRIPTADNYAVGETVWVPETTDLCRVTHTTPKRRKILAVSLITGDQRQISGPLKRIDPTLTDKLLTLYRSRQRALKAAGLATNHPEQKPCTATAN